MFGYIILALMLFAIILYFMPEKKKKEKSETFDILFPNKEKQDGK